MANAVGRPTKYTPDFIQKVDEYLAHCVDTEREFHNTRGVKSDSFQRIVDVNLPSIEGFAKYINVHNETLLDWGKKNKDFSVALDAIRREQHLRLIDGGLSGTYSPVITKLLLYNHGYKEKSDVTSDGEAIAPVLVKFINEPTENN